MMGNLCSGIGLSLLSAVLTAGALVYMALAWKNSYWGAAARLYYTKD